MKTEDWSLIVSIVSLIASVVSNVVSYRANRRSAETAVETETAKRWTLEARRDSFGNAIARIHYRDGPPVRFVAVKAVMPQGTRLHFYRYERVGPDVRDERLVKVGEESERLAVDRDSDGPSPPGATISVALKMPPKPSYTLEPKTDVHIAIEYDERDAGRQRKTIIVKDRDLPWPTSAGT